MTKKELLLRLWMRAPLETAHIVTEPWLNDLIKQGLALDAARLENAAYTLNIAMTPSSIDGFVKFFDFMELA